jgi:ElaB/YqjD/DUF883 family membrane-anchored ribosome-binding protein
MQNGAAAKLVADFKVLIEDAEGLVKATATEAGARIGDLRQRLGERFDHGKNALTSGKKNWLETAKVQKRKRSPTCASMHGRHCWWRLESERSLDYSSGVNKKAHQIGGMVLMRLAAACAPETAQYLFLRVALRFISTVF